MTPAGIFARRFEPLGCVVQLGIASGQVINVSFPDAVPEDAATDHELLDRVDQYLAGDVQALTEVDRALTLPTDQRAALEALEDVPAGNTVTVSRLARLAGLDPSSHDATEAVRDALRANPVPLLIPDHRVRDGQGATPASVAAALRRLEN